MGGFANNPNMQIYTSKTISVFGFTDVLSL